MLDSASNKQSKFRARNWVEINDDIRVAYSPNKQIRFKTAMLISSLCDYSDAYILVKGNISVHNTAAHGTAANNTGKKVIFKNCAQFTNCISKINKARIDNAEYIDIVMVMYDLIEYCDNYSKTSGSLWQYCKKIPAVNKDGDIVDFDGANATDPFSFKTKITGQTNDDGETDNVEIMVPLKYLSNFWKTLKMPLINREVELILTWYANCVIIYTNDNAKLLTQLKSGFKRTLSWTKYVAKPELLAQNANLNHLIEPGFQGVSRPFVLSFENDAQRTSNKRFCIPNTNIKDYNVMIDGKKVFDQPIKNDKITYENI